MTMMCLILSRRRVMSPAAGCETVDAVADAGVGDGASGDGTSVTVGCGAWVDALVAPGGAVLVVMATLVGELAGELLVAVGRAEGAGAVNEHAASRLRVTMDTVMYDTVTVNVVFTGICLLSENHVTRK
jgi:hypothetical protein